MVFTDMQPLASAIVNRLDRSRDAIIGLEGHSGAGKSMLAAALARACDAVVVSTDAFVDTKPNANTYLEYLSLDRLAAALTDALAGGDTVLVEGICLRDTLRALGVVPELYVYVKRITPAGLWADDPDNLSEHGEPLAFLPWVDRQSVRYHLCEAPLAHADFVYERRQSA